MSKKSDPRRLPENAAGATLKATKTSPQKARLVLDLIRGMSVESALNELQFSTKKVAQPIKTLLESAIANAENNHDLNVDNLYVDTAVADKAYVMKRWRARARGRAAKILKPFTRINLVVAERAQETATKAAPKAAKAEK